MALQVPGIDVHELLQVHRRHVIETMQRYTQIKAAAGEDDIALALVVDAELFRLEGDRPLARRRRRPPEAAAAPRAAPSGRRATSEPTHQMEVSQ